LASGEAPWSSTTYRLLNEVPTVILVACVFLAVTKDTTSWLAGLAGIVGLAVALMAAVKIYQRVRES
jgi:putative membrane protein